MKARSLPTITAEQMREIDRIVVDELHIELVQMMENAGRSLAELTIDIFKPRTATVLAGSGGNGGGGLAAARHLANCGVEVGVVLAAKEESFGSVPASQLDILRRMAVTVDAEPRDAAEPSGEFPVEVTSSKVPNRQRLAETTELVLGVENTGQEAIPDLAVTIFVDDGADGAFSIRLDNPELANPNRPGW
ncbi:MAG: NAD(P)H-hydrate epimerase, partial [Actinobacteria bacterium]|nr:NAD(P)H-hydrate epimerase [Actinomycetota bacterium]